MTPADDLAAELAPALQAAFVAYEPQILDRAGNWWLQEALKLSFPTIVEEIPAMAAVSLDFIAIEFGKLTVNDMLAWISTRKAQIAARTT